MGQIETQKLFINNRNYTFTKYDHELGNSGHLVMAVNKKNPQIKWIVKHEIISDIFAEFFFSMIANDLGFSVPECRMGDYKSKLAVYVRYLENLKRVLRADYNDEIYKRMFLMNLFGNDDREEFYVDENNNVWQLDNSWSFYDEVFIKLIYHKESFNFDAAQVIEQNKHNRFQYIKNNDFRRAFLSVKARVNGKELAKEVLQGVCKLDIAKYKIICDEISLFTANEIGESYYDYILEVIRLAKNALNENFTF